MKTSNAANWFEIGTANLDRATRFYEQLLAVQLHREEFMGKSIAIFPSEDPGSGGCLLHDDSMPPGPSGSRVFLNANGKLDAALSRVTAAGGAVVLAKTDIGPPGFIALVRDTEGNLVGLHSAR
jgi:predicted enzyme related to lactoylglutathione lyase